MELTREDWEIITEWGKLCNDDDELDLTNFRIMMQRQLASYVQVCACSAVLLILLPHSLARLRPRRPLLYPNHDAVSSRELCPGA